MLQLGPMYGTAVAVRRMLPSRAGSIVNVSSIQGIKAFPRYYVYGAAKAAVVALSRSVAVDYGPYGIRCNAVLPGTIETPMLDEVLPPDVPREEALRQEGELAPMGRIAQASEIADCGRLPRLGRVVVRDRHGAGRRRRLGGALLRVPAAGALMALGLDCTVLRDLFGTEETRAAVTSEALVQGWLDAERALAEAQAEIGMIPAAAAERIAQECVADRYDLDAVRAGIAESQHPLVPLIRMLVERCGEHGAWVHWGATTQDIIDTGLVLQLRAGLAPVRRDAGRAHAAAADLARRYRDTPQAGRTHGQHAVPISFGLKAASWADELGRVVERLDAAAGAAATAQLGGAAGTLAAMGDQAAELRPVFARRLGLAEDAIPWHAARDRVVDLGHALSQLAGAADRIAQEVIRLQATEVAELSEPLTAGHVGSSTMPQKRNPMTSEYLAAGAMLLRATVSVLPAAAAHASERDMARWGVEWLAVPQAVVLAGGRGRQARARPRGPGRRRGADAREPRRDRRADHGRGRDDAARGAHRPRERPPPRDGGVPPGRGGRRRRWPTSCWPTSRSASTARRSTRCSTPRATSG